MLKMTGTAMLTFSHALSFAFLHSTGSPGIMRGKGDNKDGKDKYNKGKRMDYSEQLFLTHSFCPLTGSQYHARWFGPGRWVRRVARVGSSGPVSRSSWVQSGLIILDNCFSLAFFIL
jgi:hypothetical protein